MNTNQPLEPQHDRPEAVIGAVSLKIPPFWPTDPQIWFAQVEAQFSTRGISSEKTKFEHIVSSLAPDYALEVRDLILSPPSVSPYSVLKEQLIARTAASEQRRLQQLFHSEDLGDRKPTQLLRRMQQLLGEHGCTDNTFLRELFLQRLPPNVRMVLASTDTKELPALANLADKIMEVATPATVSTVSLPQSSTNSEVAQLKCAVDELRRMFETFMSVSPSPRRHRSRSRGRSSTPVASSAATDADASFCWYHAHFGSSAKKCRQPCSFSGNDQASR